MLARLNSAGWCSDRIRTLNQDIADVLFTDASDAPQRLGSETSALHDNLKWTLEVKRVLDNQQFRTSSTGCGGVGGGQGTGHAPPRPPRGADTVPDVWSSLRCFSGRCWG